MNEFETSTTVGGQGEIFVAGVPFAAGTEVAVTISPKLSPEQTVQLKDDDALTVARTRMRELFARVQGRNVDPVGPLNREELYDRKVLR